MNLVNRFSLALAAAAAAGSAVAGAMDRPVGIKIGQRMTLKPYFSISASYDSNVEGRSNGAEDTIWVANPGLSLEYRSESWLAKANVFYQYNAYSKGNTSNAYSYHGYGEDVTLSWTDSLPGEKGWSLMLSEKFQFINQIGDTIDAIGHEYGRDRQEFKFAGALERRITSQLHGNVNASYYWLDYDNNNNQNSSYGLYGWERWTAGAEAGYAFSKWTDLLVAGSYQDYRQQNRDNNYYAGRNPGYGQSAGSQGYTLQAGLGSYATERLTYRVLGGWSTFDYKEGGAASDGFTYTVSGNWKISETWKASVMATSYFQPTEREYGSSQRVDSFSMGVAHAMVQGKLQGSADVAYRREGREYAAVSGYDYDLDIYSVRLGLTYILNRYLQFYTNVEYRNSSSEGSGSSRGAYYDYDRFRGTLGMRFTY